MADDFLFGLTFEFDNSGFLRGSAEAQDQLEQTVASVANARRRTEEEVTALARSLSLSPQEVKAAMGELERTQRDFAREQERQEQAQQRQAVERHRMELEAIRERTQAVTTLRDAMLSVAALTMGGGGLSGVANIVKNTSERGVEESLFAERTGTNMRQNIAEEEGAYLSGYSNREEARASIQAFSNAHSEYRQAGHSGLTDALLRAGVQITPDFFNMHHDDAVQSVVKQMQSLGYDRQQQAFLLEQSGLTSGGYTNLALHPDEMREYNQRGMERTEQLADKERQDIQFMRQWNDMASHVRILRSDIGHVLEPWVGELDEWVQKLDALAKKNPDMARNIVAATAVVVAMGGLFSALLPVLGTLLAFKALTGGTPVPSAAPPIPPEPPPIVAEGGIAATGLAILRRIFPWAAGAYIGMEAGKAHLSANDTLDAAHHMPTALNDPNEFNIYAQSVAKIEHSRYDQMGGAGGNYAGKYQMSGAAISDAARWLHETAPTRAQFLADPAMQERYFKAYTASNERTLNLKSYAFRNATPEQKLAVLGYAHNQGPGGALNWMKTGQAGRDQFGTSGAQYANDVFTNLQAPGAHTSHTSSDHSTHFTIQNMTVKSDTPQEWERAMPSKLTPQRTAYTANSGQH